MMKGFDPARLSRVHERIAERIDRQDIAGAAALVARGGEIVCCGAQGFAHIESGRRLEKDAIFQLASMTKPIIAAAILILIEEGKLHENDPVSRYLPEFRDMQVAVMDVGEENEPEGAVHPALPNYHTVPAHREITIHDLLTHSSGFGHGIIGSALLTMPKPDNRLADVIPLWSQVPLDFQPGTQTGYSGLAAFDLLGRIIEIVSDLSLDKYLEQFMFAPLGMKDMTFVPNDEQRQRLVSMYTKTDQGLARPKDEELFGFFGGQYYSGAAGLYGTLDDYYRFASMLQGGGEWEGTRILSPRMVQLMGSPQLPASLPGTAHGQIWGLGVRVITDGAGTGAPLTVGSFGWSGAWGTHFWVDPREQLVAVLMINLANAGGAGAVTAREFEVAVMQSMIDLRPQG